MKQNLLNKLWLQVTVLVALMTTALAGTAMADTKTFDFKFETIGSEGWSNSYAAHQYEYTEGTVKFTAASKQTSTLTTMPVTKGQPVEFVMKEGYTISTAKFTCQQWSSKVQTITLHYSTDGGENYTSTGITSDNFTISSNELPEGTNAVKITFSSTSNQVGIKSLDLTYTYSTGGGGSSAVATTTTIDASDITNTDVYTSTEAGSLSATVVDADNNAVEGATVTWSGNNDEVATIDEETGAVTLVAAGTVTFTATYAGVEDEYKGSSATYEMTVTDSTPIPTHSVTFSVNGATTTDEVEEGEGITFPENPADVEGKTFVGWVTEAIDGTTNDAPEFVTSATMGQSDVTFYAVFAYVDGASEAGSVELTPETDGVPSSYGTANTFTEYTFGGVEFQVMQMYKNQGKLQWRAAGNNNGTGTMYNSESLGKIESVVLTYNSSDANKNFTLTVGNTANPTDGEPIEPSSNGSVYTFDCSSYNCGFFVLANGSGAGYLDKVVINYTIGSSTISDYCTTVVAAAVARPVIEVAENPFLFSTTATITCTTDGAAIKYSFDGETWNDYSEALTITETTTIYAKAVKDNDESEVASVTITKNLAVPTIAIDATGITNTNVFDGTEAGSLAASVIYNDAAIEGAVVTWSGNNDEVATIDENGNVTLVAAGTVTFTATYEGNEDYSEKTATYEMTVTNSDPNAPGSENNPYTVAAAKEATPTVSEVYIRGIVSAFYKTSIVGDGSNYRYYISDDGTTEDQLLVYKGKGLDNEAFSNADDLKIGDVVVIYGKLTTYQNAPEVAAGNYIVSLDRPVDTTPSIELGDNVINAFAEGTDGVIIVGYKNITNVEAEVFFCDADGNAANYDWLTASINDINKLEYVINENTSTDARTAYMKVYALDDEANDVYSELITINQAGVVVDYATLPFSFNEGRAAIADTNGMTEEGLDTKDYSTANTKLKFDSEGDYVLLKLNEEPGVLFFDIKGNTLSGDYVFTVQTSTDGEIFKDLKNIRAIKGAGQTEAFALDANVRYIKWVYTTKSGGNVGLGNIFVDKVQTATVGEAGYATYVAKYNVSFPEEVEAYIATSTGYDQIKEEEYVSLTKVTSVAKGTPVVLKKEGEYTLTPVADPESAEGNLLKASDGTVEGNGTIYVLAKPADKKVGFYAVQEGTTVAEGKAYLEVAKPGVKGFVFAFADQADGIRTLSNSPLKGENIFNLAGQRIQKMQKGINIVNGKKVVLK